jgi:mono/diheme cytochrome c family protein
VLAVVPALGQISPVAVYTTFRHHLQPSQFDEIKAETGRLLGRLRVRVEWRSIEKGGGNEVWEEVAVVTFRGACDNLDSTPGRVPSGKLGWTHISDGVVLPFAEVDCDLTRGFLAPRLVGMKPKEADQRFARALGRVVAHELYHILARSTPPSSRGVEQPAYTSYEWVSDRFVLDESPYEVVQSDARGSTGHAKSGSGVFRDRGCAACHGPKAEGTRNGPALRGPGRIVSPVSLAARLGMGAGAMVRKAMRLKVTAPSVDEGEVQDLARYLNSGN